VDERPVRTQRVQGRAWSHFVLARLQLLQLIITRSPLSLGLDVFKFGSSSEEIDDISEFREGIETEG
jgi:hypothetical protein